VFHHSRADVEWMMPMFSFTDNERASLSELSAISKDTSGSEILIGLTREETVFYMNFTRQFLAGEHNYHNTGRYLNLHDKYEAARLRALGIKQYMQHTNPISTIPSKSYKESPAP
jgi:hypothetical protein